MASKANNIEVIQAQQLQGYFIFVFSFSLIDPRSS